MDIFKKIVYLLQLGESGSGPIALPLEDANELIQASKKGEKIASISEFAIQEEDEPIDATYGNVVGQDELTRFDKSKNKSKRRKKSKGKSPQGAKQSQAKQQQENKPKGNNKRRKKKPSDKS